MSTGMASVQPCPENPLAHALSAAPDWLSLLAPEFSQPYMMELAAFLARRESQRVKIYPPHSDCFNALNKTAFDQVRVVIIGQDPYHGPGQAHGLCFSVRPGVRPPPSLVNIFRELQGDLGIQPPAHGCLDAWASQGVLLLNSVLTVEQGCAGAHQGKGWERFTDRIIALLNERREHLVFILWGSYAQKKGQFVNRDRHLVLTAPHPSPLSAHRGFFGCRHFSQANRYLSDHGKTAVNWEVPPVLSV